MYQGVRVRVHVCHGVRVRVHVYQGVCVRVRVPGSACTCTREWYILFPLSLFSMEKFCFSYKYFISSLKMHKVTTLLFNMQRIDTV